MAVAIPVGIRGGGARFLAWIMTAPAVLGLAHLLPASGAGLGIRLAAAAVCVLFLPGALVLRAIGRPASPSLALVSAFAWSLAVVFVALALTFAAGGSLSLTIAVIAFVSLGALGPAALARPGAAFPVEEVRALGGVLAAGAVLAGVVWWASRAAIGGDALFHLARARKIEEFDALASVRVVREFADGGLHPGYAFPLWHGILALVARLASVDTAEVVRHLGAVLTPLAFAVSYAAGRELFRSWAGGLAALAAQAAIVGFSRDGTGSFELLALPATAARLLLVPAVLVLVFALARSGPWTLLGPLAAAGLALTLVHPTYALFLALPLAGFLAVRLVTAPEDRRGAAGITAALPALLVPFVGYTIWILPVLNSTIARGADDRARAIEHYRGQLDVAGDAIRLAPDAIARGGPAVVLGLLAVPLAALAGRRLWSALVLGATVTILLVALVPPLFTPFADAVSVSQGRRLVLFLPLAFAVAAVAVLAGRFRWLAVGGFLCLGALLQAVYPGQADYSVGEGGPGWAVWLAFVGGILALPAALLLRRDGPDPSRWAALAACAFVLPCAVTGLADASRDARPDPHALTPGLVTELRGLDRREIVFSDLETSYRIAAYAPVRIVAAPPAHVARTKLNKPYMRRDDVIRFFYVESTPPEARLAILERYFASYVVADKTRRWPEAFLGGYERVFEDGRYVLFRVREE